MRTRANDNEIAIGCDGIDFACDHDGCNTVPAGLWKDPNTTAAAIALCDAHVETDTDESAVRVMEL